MSAALKKVFNLINKTGDRCIVINPDGTDAYAIMSLSEYERMALGRSEVADLTENELLDRINRDIAVWKSQQSLEQQAAEFSGEAEQEQARKMNQFSSFSGNLADHSKKYTEPDQWDMDEDADDFDESYSYDDDIEEEPYYFEKV